VELPAVFIATQNAGEYRQMLRGRLDPAIEITIAQSLSEIPECYSGEPVVLARPDYAVELLNIDPPLAWIQSTWAGITPLVNHPNHSYQLTGLKNIFGPQMAEYVMGYLLAHELALERRIESQQQKRWDETYSGQLQGKVMGIMGTGSIGAHVAKIARQFGVDCLGLNTRGEPVDPFRRVFATAALHQFLAECDYVVSILPSVPGTDDLLDRAAFTAMKDSALLINVGRGNVIVEQELCDALRHNEIAGAVLDVFREEPLPGSSPLWTTPGLKVTGHVAAVSRPQDIANVFIENYQRYVAGERLNYLVDFAKGY
jgi:phosphoglycerate dehydrogenase-like enzyme